MNQPNVMLGQLLQTSQAGQALRLAVERVGGPSGERHVRRLTPRASSECSRCGTRQDDLTRVGDAGRAGNWQLYGRCMRMAAAYLNARTRSHANRCDGLSRPLRRRAPHERCGSVLKPSRSCAVDPPSHRCFLSELGTAAFGGDEIYGLGTPTTRWVRCPKCALGLRDQLYGVRAARPLLEFYDYGDVYCRARPDSRRRRRVRPRRPTRGPGLNP